MRTEGKVSKVAISTYHFLSPQASNMMSSSFANNGRMQTSFHSLLTAANSFFASREI